MHQRDNVFYIGLTMSRAKGISSVKVLKLFVLGSISISKCEMTPANASRERPELRRSTSLYPNSVPCLKPNINEKLTR